MSSFDYSKEPLRDILFIDVKSFYATVECVKHGWNPAETMLVVMSTTDNTGRGLTLAASPKAKEVLGISNITRADNLPDHPLLKKVPPRMSLYIQENIKFNQLLKKYVADEDLLVYSIDESILDVTNSLQLFFPDPTLSRREKRYLMAKKIQKDVYETLGYILSIGCGDNPLLAKLALDNEAKDRNHFIADWCYEDIPDTVWRIQKLTDFWGIGHRTQKRLHQIGIDTIKQLAYASPEMLRARFGIIGEQLYFHANGIDRTILSEPAPITKEKSYGNHQILPRNYIHQQEIEIVVKEMAEQVAARIRHHNCATQCIHLSIGSAYGESDSFSHQMKIPATDRTRELVSYCLYLFRKHYKGQPVRHIGVTYSKLVKDPIRQLNLFEDPEIEIAREHLDKVVDKIREKYGYTSIVHAISLVEGARSIARSKLVGGHAGGDIKPSSNE